MKEHFCPVENTLITYENQCNWCGEKEESMTQDEILEMTREAGLDVDGVFFSDEMYRAVLVRFAKLVAAKEREACAKVCEQEQEYWGWDKVIDAAKIIRARGDQA